MASNNMMPVLVGAALVGGALIWWKRSKEESDGDGDGGGKEGSTFPGVPGLPSRTPAPFIVTPQDLLDAMPSTDEVGPWWAAVETGGSTTATRSYRWAILPLREANRELCGGDGCTHIVVFVGESDRSSVAGWQPAENLVAAKAIVAEEIGLL